MGLADRQARLRPDELNFLEKIVYHQRLSWLELIRLAQIADRLDVPVAWRRAP